MEQPDVIDLDHLCLQIDQKMTEYFQVFAQIQQIRESIANAMKKGHLGIAQARHAGCQVVDYKYPTEFDACVYVQPAESDSLSIQDDLNEKKTKDNPLYWFGFLVPPSLRDAQKEFRSATINCVEIANLQQKLNDLQQEYDELLKQKQALLSKQ